jgi:hypothetical protein
MKIRHQSLRRVDGEKQKKRLRALHKFALSTLKIAKEFVTNQGDSLAVVIFAHFF